MSEHPRVCTANQRRFTDESVKSKMTITSRYVINEIEIKYMHRVQWVIGNTDRTRNDSYELVVIVSAARLYHQSRIGNVNRHSITRTTITVLCECCRRPYYWKYEKRKTYRTTWKTKRPRHRRVKIDNEIQNGKPTIGIFGSGHGRLRNDNNVTLGQNAQKCFVLFRLSGTALGALRVGREKKKKIIQSQHLHDGPSRSTCVSSIVRVTRGEGFRSEIPSVNRNMYN